MVPATVEDLRTKCKETTNMSVLAAMQQPGHHFHVDPTKDTFGDFFDELVSHKDFLLERSGGSKMVVSQCATSCVIAQWWES